MDRPNLKTDLENRSDTESRRPAAERSSSSSRSTTSHTNNSEVPRDRGELSPSRAEDKAEPQCHDEHAAANAKPRTSPTRTTRMAVVPRSKRRGMLATVAILPEVTVPYDYPNSIKWTITAVIALAGAVAPLGSGIFYPALPQISAELHATPTITNLSVAMYMIAMSIFPLWWASFSETFGRRTIYLLSFSLFVLFSVLSALSSSIAMLVVMRLLGGGASASVHVVGAGTIADIWEVRERGRAVGMFYLGPLIGPLLGPIFGGILSQKFGWQSPMWFLTAYGAVILLLLLLLLPETLSHPQPPPPSSSSDATGDGAELRKSRSTEILTTHARKTAAFLKQFLIAPLEVLLFLKFPAVLITVYYAAVTFGSLFALNISVQEAFSNPPYNYDQLIVGLLYIPMSLGYILASVFGGRWIDRIMARAAEKAGRYDENGKLIYLPEDRCRENAWIAGTVYPLCMIIYGWTVDKGLHWMIPSTALFFFGIGSMLVFSIATTALTEYIPNRSSGGVAVNNFMRNICSCVGAIIAQPAISAIGNRWLFTILGIFTWTTGYLCIWLLKKFGPRWRKTLDRALHEE